MAKPHKGFAAHKFATQINAASNPIESKLKNKKADFHGSFCFAGAWLQSSHRVAKPHKWFAAHKFATQINAASNPIESKLTNKKADFHGSFCFAGAWLQSSHRVAKPHKWFAAHKFATQINAASNPIESKLTNKKADFHGSFCFAGAWLQSSHRVAKPHKGFAISGSGPQKQNKVFRKDLTRLVSRH